MPLRPERAGLVAIVGWLALAAPAEARTIELGIQDDPVFVRQSGAIGWDRAYAALADLHVTAIRINVAWADVAGASAEAPFQWGVLDAAVDRARRAGRRVQLTLTGPAPRWASGGGRTSYVRPDARGFGRFTAAAARHFAGRVRRYSIWNEPNWSTYLLPRRRAPLLYRRLYRAAYAAIKHVDPRIEVLIGELAPMSRPEAATAPLRFLRGLTCSDRRWRARRRCAPLRADGFALHPYTLRWAPEFPGPGRDDVTTGSLRRLTGALDRLTRRGALGGPSGRRLDLYLTEWGYHASSGSIPEPLRSAYVERGLALMASEPRVRQLIWYQLAGPIPVAGRRYLWDTALLDRTGRARPAYGVLDRWAEDHAATADPERAAA